MTPSTTMALSVGVLLCAHVALADEARVQQLLGALTLEEKIALIHGAAEPAATNQGQAGFLPGVPRLGIPGLRFADGPPGVLTRAPSTALTSTMGLAATFSVADAHDNGVVIAHDAKSLGIDVVLEPYINIHRDQTFGRAYNTYGEDPLLTGTIGAALIKGVQGEGILAQAKHYIAYDGADEVTVDPQTLHEIYLPPFAAAVAAGVSSIMCSYNQINGHYACGNAQTLNDVLRGELKFEGFVTSDWGAVHATDYLNAGLDLEMPGMGADSYFKPRPLPSVRARPMAAPVTSQIPEEPASTPMLPRPFPAPPGMLEALQQGVVQESAITQAAGRILAQMDRFGLLERHGLAVPTAQTEAQLSADEAVVLRTAQDAAVLLKNASEALPLRPTELQSVAMIGPGALQDVAIGSSGEKALGHIEREIGPAAALKQALAAAGSAASVTEAVADDMNGSVIPATQLRHGAKVGLQRHLRGHLARTDATIDFTTAGHDALPAGSRLRWSGTLRVPSTGRYRIYLQLLGASGELRIDGKPVAANAALSLHGEVLQGAQDNVLPSRDGLDNVRRELPLTAGAHALALRVEGDASGQPLQVRLAWVTPEQRRSDYQHAIELARGASRAIVFAWSRGRPAFALPGDQDQLITDVAKANPNTIVVLNVSEPIAMPWRGKVKAVLLMWYPGDQGGSASAQLLLGAVTPAGRLPFTWPKTLSQNLANDPAHPERSSGGVDHQTRYAEGIYVGYRWFDQQGIEPLYPFGYGLSYAHFEYADLSVGAADDGGLDVDFTLHNAGNIAADEVPQLYLGTPQQPPAGVQFAPRALAAFERLHLEPGETRQVRLHAPPRALQYWSSAEGSWRIASGPRAVYVSSSVRDPRLQAVTSVGASAAP